MAEANDGVVHAVGHNGQLTVTPDRLIIHRRGVRSFLTQGLAGDKEILISQITAVQFRRATFWTHGYIQFSFIGGREVAGGVMQASRDENTVFFTRKQMPAFEEAKALIDRYRQAAGPTIDAAGSDVYDQLRKLADLRDSGVLTEAEFEEQKRALLTRR